ncbi:hypothetical protein H6G80_02550 [Nostoc sp. FACHB-87]|uniref:hypothetical protein n=1 Tax=Nostocales TaxID=1161 RepID=UPI0016842821|nr:MULTISPECIES: hypothetical protein [Nostocales]MBD2452981.1 hypothetical protein [Nostoc sp. FACHB-87]MBD2474837.1 hypothetical protein [Anabaena sp. FACHB-83]MBD2488177.1 hypothetical protein [Aulosira sp. FACHB-615]
MKKPKSLDFTKEQQNNSPWPIWFPYPTSWLKALILAIFLRVIIFIVEKAGMVSYRVTYLTGSIELFVILYILIILSPIPVIAFTHHFLHLFLGSFLSQIQAPEIGKPRGLLPGLMSWWEGLYGWLVIIIAGLTAFLLTTFFLPIFDISYNQPIIYYTEYQRTIIVIFGIFYISISSVIYHVEYLVKLRYISVYSLNKEAIKYEKSTDSEINIEFNKLRNEMGVYATSSKINPKIEPKFNQVNKQKFWNLKQKKWLWILITSIIAALCLIIKLVNIQNKIILSASSNNQSPTLSITSQPTPTPVDSQLPIVSPQLDNFREAVNQAISAANLTQSAKSSTEWQNIVKQWETAISLMQSVPSSSPNYVLAQQKIVEYQRNLSYAQKNATSTK